MKRNTLICVLVAAMALMAIVAVAQAAKAKGPGGQPGGCFAACQKMLGLSQEQVAEMTKIRTAFMNDTASLRTDLQAKMKEIAGLWLVADPDLGLIKQKAAEADQLRAEIRDKAIDAAGAAIKVLTPEQRAKCIKCCESNKCGQSGCGCGVCGGLGMGMCGMGCMGPGNGPAGVCPMGPGAGAGKGCGAGGPGMGGCCPMRK